RAGGNLIQTRNTRLNDFLSPAVARGRALTRLELFLLFTKEAEKTLDGCCASLSCRQPCSSMRAEEILSKHASAF
ncbi:hypothetical protein, partial [uncultured Alistipes sp.]|uniref:hypothetical protein n=1 Tax=uncultured Alistipes sp. TaxID=538949 RepID=UPI00272C8577